jgi:hypothetical protein
MITDLRFEKHKTHVVEDDQFPSWEGNMAASRQQPIPVSHISGAHECQATPWMSHLGAIF